MDKKILYTGIASTVAGTIVGAVIGYTAHDGLAKMVEGKDLTSLSGNTTVVMPKPQVDSETVYLVDGKLCKESSVFSEVTYNPISGERKETLNLCQAPKVELVPGMCDAYCASKTPTVQKKVGAKVKVER